MASCDWPVEKIPAATWPLRIAKSQDFFYGAGAVFGSGGGGFVGEAIDSAIELLAGHRQEAGNFWLAMGELQRGLYRCAKRIFVKAIGGGTGGAAVYDGSNGDGDAVFGDVLVNGVVGEAREGVDSFLKVDFGFVGSGEFAEAQNGVYASFSTRFRTLDAFSVCPVLYFFAIRMVIVQISGRKTLLPIFILRKRAGDAPCPVPMVCMG
jgi:hypothetical protein